MLKKMQSTFAGYGLISWLKTRGKIGEKAHNPTLIILMANLLIWKKALFPLVFNLICLLKGEHATTSHPQVWYGFCSILKNLTHPNLYALLVLNKHCSYISHGRTFRTILGF